LYPPRTTWEDEGPPAAPGEGGVDEVVHSSKVGGIFLEGQLEGNLRVAGLLTHSYCSAPVGEDPPEFCDLLPRKSQTPATLGGRKEGNTSLMLHAFVLVFAPIAKSHTHQ
jgi:hypothetical protein